VFTDAPTCFSVAGLSPEDDSEVVTLYKKSPRFATGNSGLDDLNCREESKICGEHLKPESNTSQFAFAETQQSTSTSISSLTNKLTIGAFVRRTVIVEDSTTSFESSNGGWGNYESETTKISEQFFPID